MIYIQSDRTHQVSDQALADCERLAATDGADRRKLAAEILSIGCGANEAEARTAAEAKSGAVFEGFRRSEERRRRYRLALDVFEGKEVG
jgi:hypothetical protein